MAEVATELDNPQVDVLVVEDLGRQRLSARRIASELEKTGWRSSLIDYRSATDSDRVITKALLTQPRLIVFSILFAEHLPTILKLAGQLRRAGIAAHITLAGPLPTLAHHEILEASPDLDSIIVGDPERSITNLVEAAVEPERWQLVDGLESRSPSKRARTRTFRTNSLDAVAFPIRDTEVPVCWGHGFATVEGSRGCYHNCSFCLPCAANSARNAGYRVRSIDNLVDEMEGLYAQGTRLYLFDDEQFLPPPQIRDARVAMLEAELEKRGLGIAFTIKIRPDDVEPNLLQRLRDIGLLRVYVGIESGCQASLNLYSKGTTPKLNARALATLDAAGVIADFRSLMFHPWSTLETVGEDLAFLESVIQFVPTCYSFHEVEIYRGTVLADRLIEEGRNEGYSWLPAYTIVDSRAEILRRLGRIVFGFESVHTKLKDSLTQAWFEVLLRERFGTGERDDFSINRLKRIAAKANRVALNAWFEMFEFVGEYQVDAGDQISELAEVCTGRVNLECAHLMDQLSDSSPFAII